MRFLVAAVALGFSIQAVAQVLDVRSFPTDGHPTQAIWTPDGQNILVTVTHDFPDGSGIEVFRAEGTRLKRVALNPLGAEPARGMLLIPNTRNLAVGLANAGVAFLPLDIVLKGNAAQHVIPQGERPGSSSLAARAAGDTLFVGNESLHGGSVGVIALRHDPKGQLAPIAIGQIPTPLGTTGIAISPDGTRLYALNELLSQDLPQRLPGNGVPELRRETCVLSEDKSPHHNGGLFVIDTAKAAAPTNDFSPQQKRDAALRLVNAGCAPSNAVVSSDGRTLYVTARGDNSVLVFDTAALEHDPDHAFLRAIPSGGFAPVGLALFDHDRKLLVANTNRFETGPGSAVVIDLINPDNPILQTIPTGYAPLNVTVSSDGRTLLVTVFSDEQLLVLTMK